MVDTLKVHLSWLAIIGEKLARIKPNNITKNRTNLIEELPKMTKFKGNFCNGMHAFYWF